MNKVATVKIIMETDEIVVSSNNIGEILLEGLDSKLTRIGINSIKKIKTAQSLSLIVKNTVNTILPSYKGSGKLFDKIDRFHDIKGIAFIYENYIQEEYFLPYQPSENCLPFPQNELQYVQITDHGDLIISIGKEINPEIEFPLYFEYYKTKELNQKYWKLFE